MNTSILQTLKLTAAVAVAGFALSGCMTSSQNDPTTDGGNTVVFQETGNMGAVLNTSTALSKTAADFDTVTHDLVIVKLHLDSTCGGKGPCFVRSAEFTSSVGFERMREDTIILDSAGIRLTVFRPGHATTISHIRHVTRLNPNGRAIDIYISTRLTRGAAGDSVVFSSTGTITGTLNGTEFISKTFSITRTYVPGEGFRPPVGVIDLQRGRFDVRMDFHGGEADCHVTRGDAEVRDTHVSMDGNES